MPVTLPKSYSLTVLRGLTSADVAKLKRAGVDSTRELLAAAKTRSAEVKLAHTTGLPLDRVREAVNRADLMQVGGVGPAVADLLENAGVNSAKELSKRRVDGLFKTLAAYVAKHPELNARLPSPMTVERLVAKAKALQTSGPAPVPTPSPVTSPAEAAAPARAALHQYVDQVLFSDQPDGKAFRDAVLAWRPSTEWPQVRQRMHDEVDAYLATQPAEDKGDRYLFAGGLMGLYTETEVLKRDGSVPRVYVEID